MSIINDSHAIGVDTRNLVLKTRGSLHVKVGDRYYEIDFRNLNTNVENESLTKEETIIFIDSKDQIDTITYPGDNKLVVGSDGSMFVTKNKTFIDISHKENKSELKENFVFDVKNLNYAHVSDRLYGDSSLELDFVNSEIKVDTLHINKGIYIPETSVKNKCIKLIYYIDEIGQKQINTKCQNYDFIEIVDIPEKLSIKSGVLIKSSVDATIPIFCENCNSEFVFENGGLYILYKNNNDLIQTRLN